MLDLSFKAYCTLSGGLQRLKTDGGCTEPNQPLRLLSILWITLSLWVRLMTVHLRGKKRLRKVRLVALDDCQSGCCYKL